MLGNLYIVATPIGNLEDVTLRAVTILSDVDIVLAEDTRVSKKLLDYITARGFQPKAQLISYHQHSDIKKKLEILNNLLTGKDIALVTDAGTPGISDPGNELIDYLLLYHPELKVIPIPGASAITSALSVSGFRADRFVFLGFMPKKKRQKIFDWLKDGKITFAFFESPNRLIMTLKTLEDAFGGNTRVFVARELTKIYETLYRGKITDVIKLLTGEKIKGEIVVVVEMRTAD